MPTLGEDVQPGVGHSAHGEIFNQGPRQKAYLMEGMPKIHFPVTSKSPLVQKFIEQGIGQLPRDAGIGHEQERLTGGGIQILAHHALGNLPHDRDVV